MSAGQEPGHSKTKKFLIIDDEPGDIMQDNTRSATNSNSLSPEQKQAILDAHEFQTKMGGLSRGRMASKVARRQEAAALRTKPILVTKGTGDQHRAWRAAGRVGKPSDY